MCRGLFFFFPVFLEHFFHQFSPRSFTTSIFPNPQIYYPLPKSFSDIPLCQKDPDNSFSLFFKIIFLSQTLKLIEKIVYTHFLNFIPSSPSLTLSDLASDLSVLTCLTGNSSLKGHQWPSCNTYSSIHLCVHSYSLRKHLLCVCYAPDAW